jgi:SOS regulatory protein LexA
VRFGKFRIGVENKKTSLRLDWRHTTIQLFSMAAELTMPQQLVLDFIEERSTHGESPPTYREICERFGYKSPKAAADHVAALERKGLVTRKKGRSRGLRLVRQRVGIPLLGRIAAGTPRDGFSESDLRLPLDPAAYGIKNHSRAFALQVTGDSMVGRQIFDGDIVVLEHETPLVSSWFFYSTVSPPNGVLPIQTKNSKLPLLPMPLKTRLFVQCWPTFAVLTKILPLAASLVSVFTSRSLTSLSQATFAPIFR